MRINQSGKIGAVLIVVIILALVAVAGYFLWSTSQENQTQNAADNATKENNSPTNTDKTEAEPKEQAELPFTEWGVEVPIADNTYQYRVSYSRIEGEPDVAKKDMTYTITSEKVATKCNNDGAIGMVNQIESADATKAVVDGVAYYYHQPQNACSEDKTVNEYQENASKAFASEFSRLRSSK